MGLFAERAGVRQRTRQSYRTASRMQRRRSALAGTFGVREDFSSRQEPAAEYAAAPAEPPPSDLDELEQLGQLRDRGVLTEEEFVMKKRQILGM